MWIPANIANDGSEIVLQLKMNPEPNIEARANYDRFTPDFGIQLGSRSGELRIRYDGATARMHGSFWYEGVFGADEIEVTVTNGNFDLTGITAGVRENNQRTDSGSFTADSAWGINESERNACRALMRSLRNDGVFTPPSLRGSLVLPSNIGGAHWGGLAVDTIRRIAVVPVNRLPALVQLFPMSSLTEAEANRRERTSDFEYTHMDGTPYVMRRGFVLSPNGIPCSPPPWGALVAVDLTTGLIKWQSTLGSMPVPGGQSPAEPSGAPQLGGPIVTASGLVFIGATLDRKFRAFDIETGREVWWVQLPAGGKATPMTYEIGGRQFVVIAAGGGDDFGSGDHIIAFALPR